MRFFKVCAALMFLVGLAAGLAPVVLGDGRNDILGGMAVLWPIAAIIFAGAVSIWKTDP